MRCISLLISNHYSYLPPYFIEWYKWNTISCCKRKHQTYACRYIYIEREREGERILDERKRIDGGLNRRSDWLINRSIDWSVLQFRSCRFLNCRLDIESVKWMSWVPNITDNSPWVQVTLPDYYLIKAVAISGQLFLLTSEKSSEMCVWERRKNRKKYCNSLMIIICLEKCSV